MMQEQRDLSQAVLQLRDAYQRTMAASLDTRMNVVEHAIVVAAIADHLQAVTHRVHIARPGANQADTAPLDDFMKELHKYVPYTPSFGELAHGVRHSRRRWAVTSLQLASLPPSRLSQEPLSSHQAPFKTRAWRSGRLWARPQLCLLLTEFGIRARWDELFSAPEALYSGRSRPEHCRQADRYQV
jgi:hypothetical protein